MNASYEPRFSAGKKVEMFTSIDERTHAVTNYTFLLSRNECAIVIKDKQVPNKALVTSKELWVNDDFFAGNSQSCERKFLKIYDKPKRYDISDCDRSGSNPSNA
ncbi:uncharacterized protein LOC142564897 [Dermacentor variabilis]|uniref:uncharacterized protein LOC142564897 n=1 Tax=Dermacentor variabilis TaxID=34621 RepID=UPI003F5C1DFC